VNLRATLLMAAWLCATSVQAAPSAVVQVEVAFLLGYVEGSACEFYRNGSWNTARKAQAHLRDKYKYLLARDQIETAEQFIERAASRSSLSGQDYMVRCGGGSAVTTQRWLSDELARLRTY
jgi:hypothetical protein